MFALQKRSRDLLKAKSLVLVCERSVMYLTRYAPVSSFCDPLPSPLKMSSWMVKKPAPSFLLRTSASIMHCDHEALLNGMINFSGVGSNTKHNEGNGEDDFWETRLKWKRMKRENKPFIYCMILLILAMRDKGKTVQLSTTKKNNWGIVLAQLWMKDVP